LIFVTRPNISLLNQANPVLFGLQFKVAEGRTEGRYRFGFSVAGDDIEWTAEAIRVVDGSGELRIIGPDMLIGKWTGPELHPLVARGLEDYLEPEADRFAVHYVLQRTSL